MELIVTKNNIGYTLKQYSLSQKGWCKDMFKEIKNDNYIAIVYCADIITSFDIDPFDFKSMIFTKKFTIDSRYELNDLCNYLFKECNVMPIAIDFYFCGTIDSRYRVEQKYNKMHLIRW